MNPQASDGARRIRWPALAAVLLPAAAFGVLACLAAGTPAPALDPALLWWVHGQAGPVLDTLLLACSALGSHLPVAIATALGAAWLGGHGRWREAAFLAASVYGAQALNQLAKAIAQRPRPQLWEALAHETSFGFPSGHAMQTMALAAALMVLAWRTRRRAAAVVAGAVGVVVVGFSRLYLGAHYPSDVLAGWCAALAWVALLQAVVRPAAQAAPPGR